MKNFNRVVKICINFLNEPAKNRKGSISRNDLAEWKRIEGIDQYNKKRN